MKIKNTIIKCKVEQSQEVQKFLFGLKYYWLGDTGGNRHLKSRLALDTKFEYYIIDNSVFFKRMDDRGFAKFKDQYKDFKVVGFTALERKFKLEKINKK